jgi:hypothetical protein
MTSTQSFAMRRRQLLELEDLPWFPRSVRDGGTDWLAFMFNGTRAFAPIVPKIRAAMNATGTTNVLDLCSGGGGPWMTLVQDLARSGPVNVELSDLFPNLEAFRALQARSGGRLGYRKEAVDVTNVPATLDGVRTLFNAFHHFPPEAATSILADAVRKRRAIVILEGINHRGAGLLFMPLQLPAILLLTPFVRPFRWSRLLLTYLVPLIPFLVLFDGTMSMLRLYMEDELRELVARVPEADSFEWDIGVSGMKPGGLGLLHLVGIPKSRA